MKNLLLLLAISTLGTAASAAGSPILSCKTAGAGGSLVKSLTVEQGPAGVEIQAETYDGGGFSKIKILDTIPGPTSTKYVLDANTGSKTSLVMYGKQAVIVYEAEVAGDPDDNEGAAVEFLICK